MTFARDPSWRCIVSLGLALAAPAAWRRDPATPLYGPDGFHPTPAGPYAAALTIFAGLTGGDPVGLPSTLTYPNGGTLVSVPPPLADLLQEAAAEAAAGYRDYRPPDLP